MALLGNRERLGIYPNAPPTFFDKFAATFRAIYERQPLPSAGAAEYAYMSLALAAFAPVGRATAVYGKPSVLPERPVVATTSQTTAGIPTVAGQIVGQPLYNPSSGLVG